MTIIEDIYRMYRNNLPGMVVTVVDKTGEGPQIVGAKMLVTPDGKSKGTIGGGALERIAYEEALTLLNKKSSHLEKYDLSCDHAFKDAKYVGMSCGGSITLFYEYMNPGTPLFIFGAGHVGRAVANHLKNMNYIITVVDDREGIFDGFEGGNNTITGKYQEVIKNLYMPDGCQVLIATPGHVSDYTVLKYIHEAGYKPSYIGLLGSKVKSEAVYKKIAEDFGSEFRLDLLYLPVGLDIGGSSPEEVAISIIAEMQALKYCRDGNKHMRDK